MLDGITSGKVANWDAAYEQRHTHSNKAELDKITTGKVAEWDGAVTAQHSHTNKGVLDTITTAKTAAWDSALQDAKEYTDTEIENLSGSTVDAIEGLEQTINTKISAAYIYKGSVANYSDLPESGKTVGYVYNVVNANGAIPAGTNYAWNGTAWDALGGSVDLSGYATTAVTNDLRSDLTTAQGDITTLKSATGSLSTAISNVSGAVEAKYALKSEVTAVDNKLAGYATTAITDGLDERLTEAEGDIEGYANAASAQAKTYVDTQLGGYATTAVTDGLDNRIDALEAVSGQSHTHSNKTVLDGITSSKVANWDTAYTQRHTHSNKTVLDDITSTKTDQWDNAYTKANSAVQSVNVTGVTGVDVTGTTAVTIDMTDLVIDCGEF